MTRHKAHIIAVSLGLGVLALLSPPEALAGKKECATAYVEAQKLKQEGSFKKAREQLITCSKKECLAAARKDCVAWLDEVNASMPSIVVEAKGPDGKETFDVRVSEGDELVAEKLDVNAIELDPGTHKLKFEFAGAPPIEQEVVLRQGQKNKVIELSFAPKEPDKSVEPAPPPTIDQGPQQPSKRTGTPAIAYVLGGVGVVALVGAGYFWLSASSAENDLEDKGCAPNCQDSDVDAIRQKRLFGDIALGVGVISLGVAAYFVFKPKPKAPPAEAASFDVQVAPGGAYASFSRRF